MSKEIVIKTEKTTNYIYLQDKGSSIPILFLHGFTGSHRSWDEVLEKIKVSKLESGGFSRLVDFSSATVLSAPGCPGFVLAFSQKTY